MNDILRISTPLTVWLAAFSAVYGLQGLICSPRWAQASLDLDAGRIALIATWVLSIVVQVVLLLALRSPRFVSPSRFIQAVSLALAVVALVATVWTLIPVATTSICL